MSSQTPEYGFWHEALGQVPGHSLRVGGPSGEDILAQQVEDELIRVDSDVADVDTRVGDLETRGGFGWVYVNHGQDSGSTVSIDLTRGGVLSPGEFDLLRLHGRFDLSGQAQLRLRINGVSDVNYRQGLLVYDTNGDLDISGWNDSLSAWNIAHGSSTSRNTFVTTLFDTDGDNLIAYRSTSGRPSGSPTLHRWGTYWGDPATVNDTFGVPSTLDILVTDGEEIVNLWWWVEGFRTP